MLYSILAAIYLILACITFFVVRKTIGKRMARVNCALLSWVIATVVFLPVYWVLPDYLAPRYPSAEEAFLSSGKGTPIATAKGEHSAFVIYRQSSGKYGTAILPKDDKGYWNSNHTFFQKERKSLLTEDGCRISTVQFRSTSDLYLWGIGLHSSDPVQISGNQSVKPVRMPGSVHKSYLFCICLPADPETLSVTIDDTCYPLF